VARSPGNAAAAVVPRGAAVFADQPLSREGLLAAVAELAARDADLAGIVARHGPPPLWDREPGFATLLHIVLEQQVSLASAQAAFDRLRLAADPLRPERFLELTDAELLAIGFSRQKARYGRALAEAIDSGSLDLDTLAGLDDDAVHRALQALPGIGPWTSTIYLLMVLGRPDVWPTGDMALAAAVGEVKGLDHRPGAAEMTELGATWRPWRSVAARLFWHDYLARRGRPG
jgi:DNA-3-methyladenine glycosylase II